MICLLGRHIQQNPSDTKTVIGGKESGVQLLLTAHFLWWLKHLNRSNMQLVHQLRAAYVLYVRSTYWLKMLTL